MESFHCFLSLFLGREACFGVGLVRIWVQPAFSLVFHPVGCRLGLFAAVVTLDHVEREINAGRKSTRRGEITLVHEPGSALQLDIRKLRGESRVRTVMRSRGFAGQ